jgi:hypothetical protein
MKDSCTKIRLVYAGKMNVLFLPRAGPVYDQSSICRCAVSTQVADLALSPVDSPMSLNISWMKGVGHTCVLLILPSDAELLIKIGLENCYISFCMIWLTVHALGSKVRHSKIR